MTFTNYDHATKECGHCYLLCLPTELRDNIIAHSVQNDAVTISGIELLADPANPANIARLESCYAPIVSYGYDIELMEATLLQDDKLLRVSAERRRQDYPTTLDALKATCKSLRSDVEAYLKSRSVKTDIWTHGAPLDLYLTFPQGVCAMMERFPNLLTRVRNIKIASVFDIDKLGSRAWCRVSSILRTGAEPNTQTELQNYQLSRLVTFLTGRNAAVAQKMLQDPRTSIDVTYESIEASLKRLEAIRARPRRILQHHTEPPQGSTIGYRKLEAGLPRLTKPLPLEHFHFRILYPNRGNDDDVYAEIWSCDTPSSLVLHHMFGVHIWLSTARGQKGTSIEIEAVPNAENGRTITSLWPKIYTGGPEGVLAPAWMKDDGADKEWKSVGRSAPNVCQ